MTSRKTKQPARLVLAAVLVGLALLSVTLYTKKEPPTGPANTIADPAAPESPESGTPRIIRVAFGNTLPPWVLTETNSGIIVDIMREALKRANLELMPIYYPHARRVVAYNNGEVDAVCDVNRDLMAAENMEGHLSRMRYVYDNHGISLKEKGFQFQRIGDLAGHTVLSWQGAKNWFKGEYKEMADANENYRELSNIKLMVKLLYKGRADLVQMDLTIFKYYRKLLTDEGEVDTGRPIDIFPLFWGNRCGFLFRDKAVRELFDSNVDGLKSEGRYDRFYEKYIGK